MFKSIFAKLLITYLAIIISAIAVLSLVITMIYNWYIFDQKQKKLEMTGAYVNEMVNKLENKAITPAEFNTSLDAIGYISDAKIYVLRISQKSLTDPKGLQLGADLEQSNLISDLCTIVNGGHIFRKKQYSPEFDTYVVFSGIPWNTDSGIAGAILLFSPISQIYSNLTKLNLVIWLTALVFILLSAMVIYLNSLRISKPIKAIERAAGRLAAGENSEDLVVQSSDEIGKLAQSFNTMKQQLANTEKMRREFIANVSHDLRTPLTSIHGFVSGILDGIIKPEDYTKYLNLIKDETLRLSRLTTEILQLAKIQAGQLKLCPEKLNVKHLMDSVLSSTRVLIEEKSINVTVACDPTITIHADRDKLKQILINIIDNAVKYSGQGGELFIKVSPKPATTEFKIKDTGTGIPAAELPFIFEKFYRVDKSRQAATGGTGLGLNIAKSLVELHGGEIWVESELGAGTEVIFELPA